MEPKSLNANSSAAEIMRNLDQCRKHLKTGNLFSCISNFHDVLDEYINAIDITESDRIKVMAALNDFQQLLSKDRQFQDSYGTFSFRHNDFDTSLNFINQLIKIREEEISDFLLNKEIIKIMSQANLDRTERETMKLIVTLVERGEQYTLQEIVAENDLLAYMVLSYYNDTGINDRISGNTEKAIKAYRKALSISPNDENLYYNIARAYLEQKNNKAAEVSIDQALVINPDFGEGLKLQQYIRKLES
jgi:tetratricopeptide (TPR) repeat protein